MRICKILSGEQQSQPITNLGDVQCPGGSGAELLGYRVVWTEPESVLARKEVKTCLWFTSFHLLHTLYSRQSPIHHDPKREMFKHRARHSIISYWTGIYIELFENLSKLRDQTLLFNFAHVHVKEATLDRWEIPIRDKTLNKHWTENKKCNTWNRNRILHFVNLVNIEWGNLFRFRKHQVLVLVLNTKEEEWFKLRPVYQNIHSVLFLESAFGFSWFEKEESLIYKPFTFAFHIAKLQNSTLNPIWITMSSKLWKIVRFHILEKDLFSFVGFLPEIMLKISCLFL